MKRKIVSLVLAALFFANIPMLVFGWTWEDVTDIFWVEHGEERGKINSVVFDLPLKEDGTQSTGIISIDGTWNYDASLNLNLKPYIRIQYDSSPNDSDTSTATVSSCFFPSEGDYTLNTTLRPAVSLRGYSELVQQGVGEISFLIDFGYLSYPDAGDANYGEANEFYICDQVVFRVELKRFQGVKNITGSVDDKGNVLYTSYDGGFSSEKNGWCIANAHQSFGYDDSYSIPAKRYYETFGLSLSSLVQSIGSLFEWNGSCFGLSLLAIANYNEQIDLSGFFKNSGGDLYEYGYSSIDELEDGKQFFTVAGNDNIIDTIERAQLSQSAKEFKVAEVYQDDYYFEKLISDLKCNNSKPILVGIDSQHAVVIDTTQKPIMEDDGVYVLKLYDSNAPATSDKLVNPEWWYEQEKPFLLVDTKTGNWQYWRNGERLKYMSRSFMGIPNIRFYDVSKLDSDFFYEPLSLFGNMIQIRFEASEFVVKGNDGESLFEIIDNRPTYIDASCDFTPIYDGDESSISGVITIPQQKFDLISRDSMAFVCNIEDGVIACSSDDDSSVSVDRSEGEVFCSVSSDNESNVQLGLQRYIDSGYRAVCFESDLHRGSLTFSINEEEIEVLSSEKSMCVDIELETEGDSSIKSYKNVKANQIESIDLEKSLINFAEENNEGVDFVRVLPSSVVLYSNATPNTAYLTATVASDDSTTVTWSSNNTSVATVDEKGMITAVGNGTAIITATAGGKFDTCSVTVTSYNSPGFPLNPSYPLEISKCENGKVSVSPTRPKEDATVTITATPDEGYKVGSVSVTDKDGKAVSVTNTGNGKYTFKQPDSKVTITVTFVWDGPFTDVGEAWYTDAIKYVYENGLMVGTSATTFEPGDDLTRAQVAQILYNLEGEPAVTGNSKFGDVTDSELWYYEAVLWAEQNGVVGGYPDNTFLPNEEVSREEFAQMMYNYAKYKKLDLTAKGDLSKFPDGEKVGDWAKPAMVWANGNELINGHDDGTLEPGGTTTRAQAASIIMNFDLNVVK